MWQRISRLIPALSRSFAPFAWIGGWVIPPGYFPQDCWVIPPDHFPPDRPGIPQEPDCRPTIGPSAGHPERLAYDQPLTPAERELWASLEGSIGDRHDMA